MTKVLVVSDFNADVLSRFLEASSRDPQVSAEAAPYGQLAQSLTMERAGSEKMVLCVWTRPEGVSPSFRSLLEGDNVPINKILDDVNSFANLLAVAAKRFRFLLVASWVRSQEGRGSGVF